MIAWVNARMNERIYARTKKMDEWIDEWYQNGWINSNQSWLECFRRRSRIWRTCWPSWRPILRRRLRRRFAVRRRPTTPKEPFSWLTDSSGVWPRKTFAGPRASRISKNKWDREGKPQRRESCSYNHAAFHPSSPSSCSSPSTSSSVSSPPPLYFNPSFDFVLFWRRQETKLPGDILLITAFVSYMGCFTKSYRQDLMYKMWLPFYMKLEVTVDWMMDSFDWWFDVDGWIDDYQFIDIKGNLSFVRLSDGKLP